MGSSNLNDRSQCGDRDSEIALVVEDKEMVPSKVNGQDVSEVFSKWQVSPNPSFSIWIVV
jgi:phosphatidylserine/phosphatidylglycerophosphate/cardiolipin synthase-like enzyme